MELCLVNKILQRNCGFHWWTHIRRLPAIREHTFRGLQSLTRSNEPQIREWETSDVRGWIHRKWEIIHTKIFFVLIWMGSIELLMWQEKQQMTKLLEKFRYTICDGYNAKCQLVSFAKINSTWRRNQVEWWLDFVAIPSRESTIIILRWFQKETKTIICLVVPRATHPC